MIFDIYIFVIAIIIVMLFYSIYLIRFSPDKIKIVGSVAIILMIIRYICVIIMLLSHNIRYLYLLKIPYFLNFLGIPIIAFVLIYIFIRKSNISFNYVFLISFFVFLLYIFAMYEFPVEIKSADNFGYTMIFEKSTSICWAYIIFNTFILFISSIFSGKKYVNKLGLYMVELSSIMTIIENLTIVINIRILPENILGDMWFIFTFLYALKKVRK
ncbi:hypothetical protein J2Z42_001102 [Clostridium algifaecis]|uniref:Uncharacterized protein n=1 Tax=Clostridium algifaecis TaxID=1472040 RepID=A0ABS4KQX1_9CLOT|nr:hypothetical protein [Clostridium algifaecis]MBP2032437.1 hypothetical protein [Clostridium algifaecis]